MSRLQRNIRPHLLGVKPYSSARDEFSGEAVVFLDANENAWAAQTSPALARYPDPLQLELKREIAALYNRPLEEIFLGNGSDEAIDLLVRLFCEPDVDAIQIFPPTYGMYTVAAELQRVRLLETPLSAQFALDPQRAIEDARSGVKLSFLCSPNNPSGNTVGLEEVRRLLAQHPGYVVVDEAYVDFCPEKSVLALSDEFDNLIVLRTLSKYWGLAGIRLGVLLARQELVSALNRIKPPYNVNNLSQQFALAQLRNPDAVEQRSKESERCRLERSRLTQALNRISFVREVFPSDANFLLVRFDQSRALFEHLLANGVVVRDRSAQLHCANCLRISIGTETENDALLEALRSFRG